VIGALLLALPASGFSFSGGGPQDLLLALSTLHPSCTCLLAEPDQEYGKVTIRSNDPKDIARLLESKAGIRTHSPFTGGYAPSGWPDYILRPNLTWGGGFPWAKLQLKEADLGKSEFPLTIETKADEAIKASSLEGLDWSRRFWIHPFLRKCFVRVKAVACSEQDFAKAIAGSIGGTLKITAQEFRIDFDPTEFRARGIKGWNRVELEGIKRIKGGDDVTAAQARFSASVLESTADKVLRAGIESRRGEGSAFAKGTDVHQLAWDYVKTYLGHSNGGARYLFEREMDFNQPVLGIIKPDGQIAARFSNSDQTHVVDF
jgi:hypothetical protein